MYSSLEIKKILFVVPRAKNIFQYSKTFVFEGQQTTSYTSDQVTWTINP